MGVTGLWQLLSPCGRNVSVETLRGQVRTCVWAPHALALAAAHVVRWDGQVLAIDASIWLTQFIKAMRDQDGNMMHNAHLLGMFRRICKVRHLAPTRTESRADGVSGALSLSLLVFVAAAVPQHPPGVCL